MIWRTCGRIAFTWWGFEYRHPRSALVIQCIAAGFVAVLLMLLISNWVTAIFQELGRG